MLRVGERIGPLRVERALGVGGMGEVYLARDERLERLVAVKLLPESRSLDPDARGRMLREARAASALHHPSIVTVYDIGEHDGRAYIVMEFVDGETFDAMIARRGRLAPSEAIELFAQVGDAVAAAHAAGVLHRDLKSANLMVDASGRAKVLDFGLSKRTDAGAPPSQSPSRPRRIDTDAPTASPDDDPAIAATVTPVSEGEAATHPATSRGSGASDDPQTSHGARMGTPGWAPPELMDGLPADARSDVFSLGCVLYHLLAGKPPFPGRTWSEVRAQIDRGAAPPSGRPGLDAVVASALAADPARRPDGVRALVDRAEAALARPRRTAIAIGASAFAAASITGIVLLAQRAPAASPVRAAPDATPRPPDPPGRVTNLGGCAYSPTLLDDDTVVFDLTRDGNDDLYRLVRGGEPERLTTDPGWEWRPSRGASPSEVVFMVSGGETDAHLEALDLDTGTRRKLSEDGASIVHAGGAYYYAQAEVVRRLRGQRDDVLIALARGETADTLAASPAGDRLAMIVLRDQGLPRVCVSDVTRPALRCADEAAPSSGRPAFSADGRSVYFDDSLDNLVRWTIDTGELTPVVSETDGIGGLTVSPSGRTMMWSECGAHTELIRVLADPHTPIVDDANATGPVSGPGGWIGYVHSDDQIGTLMARDPAGVTRALVGGDREGTFIDLSFDATSDQLAYVFHGSDGSGIYTVRMTGGTRPNRITESDVESSPVFVGDELVFTRRAADGTPQLMRVASSGGEPTLASKLPRMVIGSDLVHGRVLLASPALDVLYWWDPQTGKETAGPAIAADREPQDFAISPDGAWLIELTGSGGQEIYVGRTDAAGPPALVFQLRGETARWAAIDEHGQPVVAVDRWAGELWRADAAAGAPW